MVFVSLLRFPHYITKRCFCRLLLADSALVVLGIRLGQVDFIEVLYVREVERAAYAGTPVLLVEIVAFLFCGRHVGLWWLFFSFRFMCFGVDLFRKI